jgi:hypothetical protein
MTDRVIRNMTDRVIRNMIDRVFGNRTDRVVENTTDRVIGIMTGRVFGNRNDTFSGSFGGVFEDYDQTYLLSLICQLCWLLVWWRVRRL